MRKRTMKRIAGSVVALGVLATLATLPADGPLGAVTVDHPADDRDDEQAAQAERRPSRPGSTTTTTTTPPAQVELTPVSAADSSGGGGSTAPVVDALAASGIPEIAMRAYLAAQNTMATKDPACNVRWSLLAALGRVESNHGRFQGTQLREDGTGTKPIRGIPLDGRPGVMTIRDTDGGQLDGDPIYDRAVGPFQFIPSSWRFSAADGNGDGRFDPDNIFDAALAAAGYLCAGDTNLADPIQRAHAVFRYNHSQEYVQTVLSLADQYERGPIAIPTSPPVPPDATTPELPSPELPPASPPGPPVDIPPAEQPPLTTPTTVTPPSSSSSTTSSTTTTTTAPCPTTTTTSTTSTETTTTTTTVPGTPCPTTTTTVAAPPPSSSSTTAPPSSTSSTPPSSESTTTSSQP